MTQIVLHIGLPKTAMPQIQNAFCAQSKVLADHGIGYLQTGSRSFDDRGHHVLAQAILGVERGKSIRHSTTADEMQTVWAETLAELDSSMAAQILISSELFSFVLRRPDDILALKTRLYGYDVRVVLVLRDVTDFVDGVFAQRVQSGYAGTVGDFISDAWSNLNWRALFDRWADVFGADNVRALDYALLRQGNVTENFVRRAFDVDVVLPDAVTEKPEGDLPYNAVQMLREINASGIPAHISGKFRSEILGLFDEHSPQGTFRVPKFLDQDTQTMLRHYCKWPTLHGTVPPVNEVLRK